MAHQGLTLGATLGLVALAAPAAMAGCSGGGASSGAMVTAPSTPASSSSHANAFVDDFEKMKRFHSKRFGLVIPFPDGAGWRIDDHSKEQLVATHAATASTITVSVFPDDDLVNRQKCEARARAMNLVPRGDLRTLEDSVTFAMHDYDTRVWVAIEPPGDPSKKLVGHVFAFGGFLRKCFFFHYASESRPADDDALSGRLAFAKTRILGEMRMDSFVDVPKERTPLSR